MGDFESNLGWGRAAESAIARWLRARGGCVLPVYEKIIDDGKGPQVFTPEEEVVAPDFLSWNTGGATWIEAKHKTAFSWHRITGRWVTGIDRRHYRHYLRIAQVTPWPVWLLFLHEGGQAKDSPAQSPAGLFGRNLVVLARCIHHESDRHGKSGMVYWAIESLKKLAALEELSGAGVANGLGPAVPVKNHGVPATVGGGEGGGR